MWECRGFYGSLGGHYGSMGVQRNLVKVSRFSVQCIYTRKKVIAIGNIRFAIGNETKQETLRIVTIAMIYSSLTSL